MSTDYPAIVDAVPPGWRYQSRQAREQLQGREDQRGLPRGERALQAVDPGLPVPPVQAFGAKGRAGLSTSPTVPAHPGPRREDAPIRPPKTRPSAATLASSPLPHYRGSRDA